MNPARAKSFIYQLMAFILLSLSTPSTEAAEMCQGLFLPSANLFSEMRSLRENLTEYRESSNSLEKRPAMLQQIQNLERQVQKHLESEGILFQATSFRDVFLNLEWTTFEIKTEGSHWLNKMAKAIKTNIGATTVFDPVQKALAGFEAAYDINSKTIFLSTGALLKKHAGDAEIHEIMHAYFDAARDGKVHFMPKAPVHIVFHSEKNIDPQDQAKIYQNYMTFEEIVNYAYNISYPAKQSLKKGPTEAELKKIKMRINSLVQVSRNAKIAAEKGLALIQQGQSHILPLSSDNKIMIGKPGPETYLEVSLKTMPAGVTPQQFASTELQRAQKLAEFNIKYFAGKDHWTDQQLLEKSRDFRNAQKDFIEAL